MRQTRFLLQDDESLEQSPTLKNSSESFASLGLSCTIHSYHTFQLQSATQLIWGTNKFTDYPLVYMCTSGFKQLKNGRLHSHLNTKKLGQKMEEAWRKKVKWKCQSERNLQNNIFENSGLNQEGRQWKRFDCMWNKCPGKVLLKDGQRQSLPLSIKSASKRKELWRKSRNLCYKCHIISYMIKRLFAF